MLGIMNLLSPSSSITVDKKDDIKRRKPMSDETKAKISKALTGRKLSEAHLHAIVTSTTGKERTTEYKLKQKESALLRKINKPVMINDVRYNSAKEASKILKKPMSTIRYRCGSNGFINYKYL